MHGELVLDTQHFEHGDDIDERDFGTDTTITHALRSSSSDVQVRPIFRPATGRRPGLGSYRPDVSFRGSPTLTETVREEGTRPPGATSCRRCGLVRDLGKADMEPMNGHGRPRRTRMSALSSQGLLRQFLLAAGVENRALSR